MKHVLYAALALTMFVGCAKKTGTTTPSPPTGTAESRGRDVSAALGGLLKSAQSKYHDSCVANNKQSVCQQINRAGAAQNALITALDTYCGWPASTSPPDPNQVCVPIASGQQALIDATTNAATFVAEIQSVL